MSAGERIWDIFGEIAPILAIVLCLIALALSVRSKKKGGDKTASADNDGKSDE